MAIPFLAVPASCLIRDYAPPISRAGTLNCIISSITLVLLRFAPNSLQRLKRKATDLLSEIAREKQPILITQHGRPSAYLVDVESYEKLQSRMRLLEAVARGEKAVEDGRALTHEEAKSRMSRWLK